MRTRATYMGALLAVAGALVIAGCGGGSSSSSSRAESGGEAASATTGTGTISGTEVGGFGAVLVDSEGMTVYDFTEDEGTTSVCYGGCESAWPPVLTKGKPSAGEGASPSALGTTKRKDGSLQVTYEGHPLYTFAGDEAPGEANGQEVDGTWFVLDESGSAVDSKAKEEGSSPSYGGY